MRPDDAVELVRNAVLTATLIGSPLLLVGMVVGLVISFDPSAHADSRSDAQRRAEDHRHGRSPDLLPTLDSRSYDQLLQRAVRKHSCCR